MRVLTLIIFAGTLFIGVLWVKEQQRIVEWYYRAYPETPDVVTFVQSVLRESEYIRVEEPYNGQYVSHTFPIRGEARGGWFRNGTFDVRIENENGAEIGRVTARVEGEVPQETGPASFEFVPFHGEVSQPYYSGPATLIFIKAGSGPGKEKEKRISVTIQ